MTDRTAALDRLDPAHAGQAVYTQGFLSVYDAVVYGFNSPVLWRCPKARVVAHYDACRFPVAAPELTLMDLKPNSLAAAARRLARYAPAARCSARRSVAKASRSHPWPAPSSPPSSRPAP
jgi:hypothetical protein